MLSELLRFSLLDKHQKTAKLADLSFSLLEEDYPPISHLFFFNTEKKLLRLAWDESIKLDSKQRQIRVADLTAAEEASPGAVKGEVLVRRDVLDALILDLKGRTMTRANDLAFELNGQLRLRAADAKFSGMLRRISRGLYGHVNEERLYDWKYIEFLRGDPEAADSGAGYNMRIARLPAGEIASLAGYLPYLHAAELLTLLPDEKAADVLEAMPVERQVQVIEEFDEDEALELINLMSPDLAVDLLRLLHAPTMKRYLERLPQQQSARLIELLKYPEDSVGGVMVNDTIFLCADLTVRGAREQLRERLKGPDFVALIFLVDDEKKRILRGAIALRQLLTEDDNRKLEDLMDPYIATLSPQDSAKAAAYRIVDGQVQAMPVTGKGGKLLGAMTVDQAVAQISRPASGVRSMRVFS